MKYILEEPNKDVALIASIYDGSFIKSDWFVGEDKTFYKYTYNKKVCVYKSIEEFIARLEKESRNKDLEIYTLSEKDRQKYKIFKKDLKTIYSMK